MDNFLLLLAHRMFIPLPMQRQPSLLPGFQDHRLRYIQLGNAPISEQAPEALPKKSLFLLSHLSVVRPDHGEVAPRPPLSLTRVDTTLLTPLLLPWRSTGLQRSRVNTLVRYVVSEKDHRVVGLSVMRACCYTIPFLSKIFGMVSMVRLHLIKSLISLVLLVLLRLLYLLPFITMVALALLHHPSSLTHPAESTTPMLHLRNVPHVYTSRGSKAVLSLSTKRVVGLVDQFLKSIAMPGCMNGGLAITVNILLSSSNNYNSPSSRRILLVLALIAVVVL